MEEYSLNQLLESKKLQSELDKDWVKEQIRKYPYNQNWRTLLTKITQGAENNLAVRNAAIYQQPGNFPIHQEDHLISEENDSTIVFVSDTESDIGEAALATPISDASLDSQIVESDLNQIDSSEEIIEDIVEEQEVEESILTNEDDPMDDEVDSMEMESTDTDLVDSEISEVAFPETATEETNLFESATMDEEADLSDTIQEASIDHEVIETDISGEADPDHSFDEGNSNVAAGSAAAAGSFGLIYRLFDWMDEKPSKDDKSTAKAKKDHSPVIDKKEETVIEKANQKPTFESLETPKKKEFNVELLEETPKKKERKEGFKVELLTEIKPEQDSSASSDELTEIEADSTPIAPIVKREYSQRVIPQDELDEKAKREKELTKEHLQKIANKDEVIILGDTESKKQEEIKENESFKAMESNIDPKVDPMLTAFEDKVQEEEKQKEKKITEKKGDGKKAKIKAKKDSNKKSKKKKKDKKKNKIQRWLSYTPEDYNAKNLSPYTEWLNSIDNTVYDLTSDLKSKDKKKKKKRKKNIDKLIFKDDIVSEPLAKLLENQGHKTEAIEMYKKLSLKFPQKSSFFAGKIKDLQVNE